MFLIVGLCIILTIAIYISLFKKEKISLGRSLLVSILAEMNFLFWGLLVTAGVLYLKWDNFWLTAAVASLLVLGIRIGIGRYIFRKFRLSSQNTATIQYGLAGFLYVFVLGWVLNSTVMEVDPPQSDTDKLVLLRLSQSLQMYYIHNNKYPTSAEGLNALLAKNDSASQWRGPYIEKSKTVDSRDNPFQYESDGKEFTLRAAGLDEKMDTDDDIIYPEKDR